MLTEQHIRDALVRTVEMDGVGGIGADEDFFDAGLDSLDHASVLLALQEEHGLTIPNERVGDCRNINAILRYAKASS